MHPLLLRTLCFALALLAVSMVVSGPSADAHGSLAESGLVLNVITPVFAIILTFIPPLDVTMTRVFMNNGEATEEPQRYKYILLGEAVLRVVLLVAWLPFVLTAVQQD